MGAGHRSPRTIGVLLGAALLACERTELPAPADPAAASSLAPSAAAGPAHPDTARSPRFADYPVAPAADVDRPAPVDLSSHPDAREFRTVLARGAAAGPNFAGRFTVVTWGCGTRCQQLRIVDARTGRVFEGPVASLGVAFRLDSRLLVVNPPGVAGERSCPGCETAYYVWENQRLSRLRPRPAAGSASPPPAARALVREVRSEEEPLLRPMASSAVIRSSWDRLTIHARNGTRHDFVDEVAGEDLRRIHLFQGYLRDVEAYLVAVRFLPEGGQLLLVQAATGRITEVDAPPVPSPDGSRFVTASMDLVAGHSPNRVRIYRVTEQGPVLEWEVGSPDWGAQYPRWQDGHTIVLERGVMDWSTHEVRTSPMRLERAGGEWRVHIPG